MEKLKFKLTDPNGGFGVTFVTLGTQLVCRSEIGGLSSDYAEALLKEGVEMAKRGYMLQLSF